MKHIYGFTGLQFTVLPLPPIQPPTNTQIKQQ